MCVIKTTLGRTFLSCSQEIKFISFAPQDTRLISQFNYDAGRYRKWVECVWAADGLKHFKYIKFMWNLWHSFSVTFLWILKLIHLLIKFLVFRHQLFYAIQNTQKLYFSARKHSEQDQKNVVKSRKREKANGNGAK